MKPDVHDLRILRLAQLYEEAYETFVREVARELVTDEALRRRLERLAPPDDEHGARIAELLGRIRDRLGPDDALAAERAAIQDVLDVERAAREFYLRHVDDLHDPEAVALFRDLAREESEHVRVAEQVLDAHDARMRRAGFEPRLRRIHDVLDMADPPLREGAGDLGRARRRPEA